MNRSAARRRSASVLCGLVAAACVAACGLPSDEELLAGSEVASSVRQELQIPLKKVEQVDSTAVLANVREVYTGRSSNETVMIVDFGSAAATVQLASGGARSPRDLTEITRGNVVVIYHNEPGTISRFRELRDALFRVPARA
jgi:hypothetical protein